MRVYVNTPPYDGCGYYRCFYPMSALQAKGYDVRYTTGGETIELDDDGTVIVLHRIRSEEALELVEKFHANNTAVVYEIDDDVSEIDPRHPHWREYNPEFSRDNWDVVQAMADMADLVTVTTDALMEKYGRNGRAALLPNFVMANHIIDKLPDRNTRYVGWTGKVETHPGDLEVIAPVMKRVLEDTGWGFTAIGDSRTLDVMGIPGHVVPFVDGIENYLQVLGDELDIGLVPLAPTKFNEAKSWLKGLEYAARGVPFLATDTREYNDLEQMDVGVTVPAGDWAAALTDMMTDEAWRRHVAERSLAAVRSLTYENHAWRWWRAYEQAWINFRESR